MAFNRVNKKKYIDRYNRFMVKFCELNGVLLDDIDKEYKECGKLPCRRITIFNEGNVEIVLPKGYEIVNNANKKAVTSDVTYICDKDGKVACGISYKCNDMGSYAYPKRFIVLYEEDILEKASIITEQYYGSSNEDYLKLALLKMIDGNYNYFTKYDNTRFKLMLLSARGIPKIMTNTLKRNNMDVPFSSIGRITELYVDYIKVRVNSINKGKSYTKSIK